MNPIHVSMRLYGETENKVRYKQVHPDPAELNVIQDLYVGRDALHEYARAGQVPDMLEVTLNFKEE